MSLKEDLAAAPRPRGGPRCHTCQWYANLDTEDRQAFDEYVSEPDHNRAVLFRVISEKWGYTSCDSALKYHLANHHGSR